MAQVGFIGRAARNLQPDVGSSRLGTKCNIDVNLRNRGIGGAERREEVSSASPADNRAFERIYLAMPSLNTIARSRQPDCVVNRDCEWRRCVSAVRITLSRSPAMTSLGT